MQHLDAVVVRAYRQAVRHAKQQPGEVSHTHNCGYSCRFAVHQSIVHVCVALQAGCWSWKQLPIQM